MLDRLRNPIRLLAPVIASSVLALSAVGVEADEPFPDEYFYGGAERSEKLRALEGTEAPEIRIQQWEGDPTTLSDLRGKVVVLDFWATWCGPCVAAIPKNIDLVNKHKDDDFAFIGVHDAASGWNNAPAMIQDKGINYPVGLDESTTAPSGRTTGASTLAYKLEFWPTYVVIDKSGVVRAVGLLPDKVGDVVEALLEEDGPAPVAEAGGVKQDEWPAEWYYGGASRPASLRAMEGQPAPAFTAESWFGDDGEWSDERRTGRVQVVQFVSSLNPISVRHLADLEGMAPSLRRQGVVFAAVCDPRSPWEKMTEKAQAMGIQIPIAHDAVPEDAEGVGPGVTASSYGVRFAPATVVIDRQGVVRAAGVRMDKVEGLVARLMSERLAAPDAEADADSN